MKLIDFKCSLIGNNGTNNWYLDNLNLNEATNLLVGQNATGKSRVIHYLNTFKNLITDNDDYESWVENYSKSSWVCTFKKNNGDIILYSFSIDFKKNFKIIDEQLMLNDNILLQRKDNKTEIYSYTSKGKLKISPPDNKLVLHIRRDKVEFPFFEDIVQWAEEAFMYEFADEESGKDLFYWFEDLNKESIEILKNDFNKLGYKLKDLYIKKVKYSDNKLLYIEEDGLDKTIIETDLSQGMSRALQLLTLVQSLLQNDETSIFLLDDLGEGLDYERATKLGKLLVEKLENSNIQFIATTNDEFMMNVIDTKYWNILEREGNTVKSLNYTNSKAVFDDFKMSGLSNFYLLTSNFLNQKQE